MPPSKTYSLSSKITLNNSIPMPLIHLGTYNTTGHTTSSAITAALQAGYRAFDSAEWYGNEAAAGSAISSFLSSDSNAGGLGRADVWFTSKLRRNVGYEETRREIRESRGRCGLGYLDLWLLHSPIGGWEVRRECWRAVEDAVGEGEVRCGGVSNFGVRHLKQLLDSNPRIIPAVNQIEVHPFNTRTDITSFCKEHGIVVQAYAPLVRALKMKHPKIVELSKKYRCTPAQLLVRWSLQHGYVPLPKSVRRERMVENGEEDMRGLDGLDEYLVTDWDPTDVE